MPPPAVRGSGTAVPARPAAACRLELEKPRVRAAVLPGGPQQCGAPRRRPPRVPLVAGRMSSTRIPKEVEEPRATDPGGAPSGCAVSLDNLFRRPECDGCCYAWASRVVCTACKGWRGISAGLPTRTGRPAGSAPRCPSCASADRRSSRCPSRSPRSSGIGHAALPGQADAGALQVGERGARRAQQRTGGSPACVHVPGRRGPAGPGIGQLQHRHLSGALGAPAVQVDADRARQQVGDLLVRGQDIVTRRTTSARSEVISRSRVRARSTGSPRRHSSSTSKPSA